MVARQRGADERRHGRGVAERLVVVGCDHRDRGDQFGRRDVVLVMVGAEVLRRDARILHLVVAGGIEADREGRCASRHLLERARDRRTVGAAGKEAAHAICHRFGLDRIRDCIAKATAQITDASVAMRGEVRLPG